MDCTLERPPARPSPSLTSETSVLAVITPIAVTRKFPPRLSFLNRIPRCVIPPWKIIPIYGDTPISWRNVWRRSFTVHCAVKRLRMASHWTSASKLAWTIPGIRGSEPWVCWRAMKSPIRYLREFSTLWFRNGMRATRKAIVIRRILTQPRYGDLSIDWLIDFFFIDSSSQLKGGNLDPDFVLSCRIRTCRNIRGFALPSSCSRAERRHIEEILKEALKNLGGALKGRYFNIKDLAEEELTGLITVRNNFFSTFWRMISCKTFYPFLPCRRELPLTVRPPITALRLSVSDVVKFSVFI